LRFSDSYLPTEFLAFRERLAAECKRLCWDKTDLNNFALQTIGNDVQNDMDKPDWEYLLAQIGDLPTPPGRGRATEQDAQTAKDQVRTATVHTDLLSLATFEELHGLYRTMSKRLHPDAGGDVVKMRELNLIWEQLEKQNGTR
jgi:hypothetical protein